MCTKCDCAHSPDLGACATYEQGMNGRCVYCDHAEKCHPGTGDFANGPLSPIFVTRHVSPDAPPETIDALNRLAVAAGKKLARAHAAALTRPGAGQ